MQREQPLSFWNRYRESLTAKIATPLVLLSVLTASLGAWAAHQSYRNHIEEDAVARGTLLGRAISYSAEALPRSNALERIVMALGGERDVDLILVVGGQPRRVLASNRQSLLNMELADLPTRIWIEEIGTVYATGQPSEHRVEETSTFTYTSPLLLPDASNLSATTNGAVLVELDTRSIEQAAAIASWQFIARTMAAIAIICILLFFALHRMVLRPILNIRTAVAERQMGRHDVRIPEGSKDEIGSLATTLNRALDAIDAHELQLQDRVTQARNAELLVREAIESITEGFVLWDTDDCLALHNENFSNLYPVAGHCVRSGVSFEALLRECVEAGVYDLDGAAPEDWIQARLEAHRQTRPFLEEKLADGRIILVTERLTADGGIVSIRMDVTLLKKQENQLREHEAHLEFLRTVALASNDAPTVEEAMSTCLNQICRHLGWPVGHAYSLADDGSGELVSTPHWYLSNPDKFAAFQRATAATRCAPGEGLPGRVLASGEPAWISDITKDRDFARKQCAAEGGLRAAFAFPVLLGNEVVAVLEFFAGRVMAPDPSWMEVMSYIGAQFGRIIERKRVANALQENEQQLSAIINTAVDGIITIDEEGIVESVNPSVERLFGYGADELIGQNVKILMPTPYKQEHDRYLSNYRETGEAKIVGTRSEVVGRRKDGSTFPFELAVSERWSGKCRMFTGMVRDITERKEAERDLRAAMEQAESASRAKSEFLATMSHEIRTPMNGVLGMTGLLLDTNLSPDQRKYAETVLQSGETLLALLNDILDISKLEAKKMDIENMDFEPAQVVESVVELLSSQAHGKGIELASFVAPEIPPTLTGDAGRLRQILMNLVGNAIKFTDKGGVSVEMTMSDDADDAATLRFAVVDSGTGIPKEAQRHLFDKFTQADSSTSRRYGGSGLGLAISKQIIALMQGEIGVKSTPGEGSTFWFTARFGRSREAFAARTRLSGIPGIQRALVVDDNPINREIFCKQLEAWGLPVTAVANGEAALAALAEAHSRGMPYDVAIIDQAMPGMNGVELAKRIGETPGCGSTALVLASSIGQPSDVAKADDVGFAAYLTKPIRQSELFDCLVGLRGNEPTATTEAALNAKDHAMKEEKTGGRRLRPLRILVAEDNPVNQMLAVAILQTEGHSTDVANNGVEALQAVTDRSYDLVLMDVQMPEMDGIQATAAIRNLPDGRGKLPIIALTANAMKGDRENYLAAGMNDYVSKPIDKAELFGVLERWAPDEPADTKIQPARDEPTGDVLDASASADLEELFDADTLKMLADQQITDTRARLDRLRAASDSGDIAALQREAHDLKSSFATFGATTVSERARALEEACRNGKRDDALAVVPGVEVAAHDALAAIERRYSQTVARAS